jgi:signal transduction histidine kinase
MRRRLRGVDLRLVDAAVAAALSVVALVDAGNASPGGLTALTVVASLVLTGAVAFRRRRPVTSALVAGVALFVFQLSSGYNGQGTFQAAAIALCFYLVGRRSSTGSLSWIDLRVFGAWLVAAAATAAAMPGGGVIENALWWWAVDGLAPFAVGRALATRAALAHELVQSTARLERDQRVNARRAALDERNRMARELHDVIAHCVSVMVVQAAGARRIARLDVDGARDALIAIEGAGREALLELRRIVGVLHRDEQDLAADLSPGLARLHSLIERAQTAGLPVELRIVGQSRSLPAELDLLAYRLVQEALTNTMKHAGAATARVTLAFSRDELEVEVVDDGRGPAGPGEPVQLAQVGRTIATADVGGGGHGLVGMGDRVSLYGGELHTGSAPGGGFVVRARIPIDTAAPHASAHPPLAESERPFRPPGHLRAAARGPWLERCIAGAFLVAFEITALKSREHGPQLALAMAVLAAIALATLWRRRAPLWYLLVVCALLIPLSRTPLAPHTSAVTAIYAGLIVPYAVAAFEDLRRAVCGLVVMLALIGSLALFASSGVSASDYLDTSATIVTAWVAGRAVRERRAVITRLKGTAARLARENEDRAQLAIAGERSRITRELHAVVAHNVAAMVIQTQAARALLGHARSEADSALGAVEEAGREALVEMRRILGVLRHAGDPGGELEPQPGVNQIYALVQQARDDGQTVELSVDGDPGPVSAGVELGVYRLVEEALRAAGQEAGAIVHIGLGFGASTLELRLASASAAATAWPTSAMRERLAFCGGDLLHDPEDGTAGLCGFTAQLPRAVLQELAA